MMILMIEIKGPNVYRLDPLSGRDSYERHTTFHTRNYRKSRL